LFKDLTYGKPNPWQPSPLIFSFGHTSSPDIETTRRAMNEWFTLASAAERNIPKLFLGTPGMDLSKYSQNGNIELLQYRDEIALIAKEMHFEVLSLSNLTLQIYSNNAERLDEKQALIEAMMVINWLSKLETS
jgi:hypothetical protein